jgi:hypothetical protein
VQVPAASIKRGAAHFNVPSLPRDPTIATEKLVAVAREPGGGRIKLPNDRGNSADGQVNMVAGHVK